MTTLVKLEGVTRRFRRGSETISALDGVDFEVSSGEFVVLMGPSGAGKTTLLNLVLDWESPDEGSVDRRVGVGWDETGVLPQSLGLIDELSVSENASLPARLSGAEDHSAELMAALEVSELAARRPSETSLGQQQRVALVRAMSTMPALVVADEPTSHQDERRALLMGRVFEKSAHTGSACLVATHDERLAELADRVVHLVDGRIVTA